MKKSYLILTLLTLFLTSLSYGQCPEISCPEDIVVDNDPGECGAIVNYPVPVGINPCGEGGGEFVTENFNFLGEFETFTVPSGVSEITITLMGASGGYSDQSGIQGVNHIPGNGGELTGTLAVSGGDVLYIFVGGMGGDASSGMGGSAGWNGGAEGGTTGVYSGGGGGGATDIRLNGLDLSDRIFVSGGGGGSAYNYSEGDNGGDGGGLTGLNGQTNYSDVNVAVGTGGSQTEAGQGGQWSGWNAAFDGTFGIGGAGANATGGGGAGGGYYGGGGGSWAGGGGGSSFSGLASEIVHTQGNVLGNGFASITYLAGGPTTTTLIEGIGNEGFFPIGTTTETYLATDEFGNTASCSFNITVIDSESPEALCPLDLSVPGNEFTCQATVFYPFPSFVDNCSIDLVELTSGQEPGTVFSLGEHVITYSATDENGNSSSCSFTISVNDIVDPEIICPSDIELVNESGSCSLVVEYDAPEVSDNCSEVSYFADPGFESGAEFIEGINEVLLTAVDDFGNQSTCTFSIEINNDLDPIIICPEDLTFPTDSGSCGAFVDYIIPVGYNPCDENVGELQTVEFTYTGSVQTFVVPAGITEIEVDMAGASAGISHFNTTTTNHIPGNGGRVQGTISVTPGETLYLYIGGQGANATLGAGGIGGFNGGANGGTTGTYSGGGGGGGTDIRSNSTDFVDRILVAGGGGGSAYNYSGGGDNGGNGGGLVGANGQSNFIDTDVSVGIGGNQLNGGNGGQWPGYDIGGDGTAGAGGIGADVTSGGGGGGGYFGGGGGSWSGGGGGSSYEGTSTDIVHTEGFQEGNGYVTFSFAGGGTQAELTSGLGSGAFFPVGTSTETYEYTDEFGATVSCSFDITIVDEEAPIITCPNNLTIASEPEFCNALVFYSFPSAEDGCGALTPFLIEGQESNSLFDLGLTTVTYEVEDIYGNSSTCSFDVNVIDNLAPIIICPDNITVDAEEEFCTAVVNYEPEITDACSETSYYAFEGGESGSEFFSGVNTIVLIAEDAFGNSNSCSFDITVLDDFLPEIICPDDIEQGTDEGSCGAVVTYPVPVGYDGCGLDGEDLLQEFAFTGSIQEIIIPSGVNQITVDLYGASGGFSNQSGTTATEHIPGNGGRIQGTLSVNPGDILYVYVGGQGDNAGTGIGGNGGFNGGATGGTTGTYSGGGGGGATDIRLNGTDLSDRIFIAGGGGGSAWNYSEGDNGGHGGDLTGLNGESNFTDFDVSVGTGGSQLMGGLGGQWSGWNAGSDGNLGSGGDGANGTSGGGAGGGYYGGGGGSWAGGGGGSSFEGTALDIVHTQGSNFGDGFAIISYPLGGGTTTTELTDGIGSGGFFPVGSTTETYTVTDESGNSVSCSFTVTINDTESPTITCPEDVEAISELGTCSTEVEYGVPVVEDECTSSSYELIEGLSSGSEFPVGVSTIVYSGSDELGNTATCSFEVLVLDNQFPEIECPDDLVEDSTTGLCGANVFYSSPIGFTSCEGTGTESDTIDFIYNGETQSFQVPAGVNQIWVEMDGASGGVSVNNSGIEVPEHIPGNGGRISGWLDVNPGDLLYINVGGQGNNATLGAGGQGGFNGGGNGNTTGSYAGGGGGGATDIRLNGTDLEDRIFVAGGGGGSAYNYGSNDNGGDGGDLIGLNGQSNGNDLDVSVGEGGSQTAGGFGGQWSGYEAGTDGSLGLGGVGANGTSGGGAGAGYYGGGGGSWAGGGGGSSYQGDATLVEHVQGINEGNGQVTIYFEGNGLETDLTSGIGSGNLFPIGTTTEVYTVYNESGESATCSFQVTVLDIEAPIIECPSDITTEGEAGTCGAVVDYDAPLVSDNCSEYSYSANDGMDSGSEFPDGINEVVLTALDAFGNESTCSFTITVSVPPLTVTQNSGIISADFPGATYQWLDCDNGYAVIPGATSQTYTPLTIGNYACQVTNGSCVDTTLCETVTVVSMFENESRISFFDIYPNPTNGIFFIETNIPNQHVAMEITNAQGQIVIKESFLSSGRRMIDIERYESGMYLIQITIEDTTYIERIIKE